jgi:predicted ATPase
MGIPVVSRIVLERSREGGHSPQATTFSLTRGTGGGYVLDAMVNESMTDEDHSPSTYTSEPSRKYRPERSLFFPWSAVLKLRGSRSIVQMTSNRLLNIFRRTYYLGPLRDYPKRTYLWSRQRPGEIGPRGEQAVAALLASAKESLSARRIRSGARGLTIVQQVSRWLKEFGIADSLELKRQGQSRFYDVIIKRDGRSASLVDVGFGVSQVLPMIVMAYFVPEGSTIIAEQPEIHLHPLAQSALADLMVEVARERRVQFIVETHSEHMFRRLQTLIADKQVSRDECRLYFAKRDDSGNAILEQLRADPYGKIENWPKNFFGDAIGETERQMRRMIERMKQERGGAGNA